MKRSIYTVIKFSTKTISVVGLEKDKDRIYDFYSQTIQAGDQIAVENFIKSAISIIESKIKGKIRKVFVQIDDSNALALKVNLIERKLAIPHEIIEKSDIKQALLDIQQEFDYNNDMQSIFVQAIQYLVKEPDNKNVKYATPPVGKKATEMQIICSKVSINKTIGTKIKLFLKKLNLEVVELLVTSNIIPFLIADKTATTTGMMNLHINEKFSTISIIKNNALINFQVINLGTENLIDQLAHKFSLSTKLITKLFKSRKSFFLTESKNIEFNQKILSNSTITYGDLVLVAQKFLSKIFEQTKAYMAKNISQKQLPLFITGKMNELVDFQEFAKLALAKQDIYLYQNKHEDYIAQSQESVEAIGVVKFINRLDDLIDYKKYNTLIDTQPIKISNLLPNKQSLLQVILKKTFNKKNLGGKNA